MSEVPMYSEGENPHQGRANNFSWRSQKRRDTCRKGSCHAAPRCQEEAGGGCPQMVLRFVKVLRGLYRGTSLIRNTPLLGPYSRMLSSVIWRS